MHTLIQKSLKVSFFICPLFLIGCASLGVNIKLPEKITHAPTPDLQYSEVIENTEDYKDVFVRWGGEILNVIKGEVNSEITVLEHPITDSGKPDYKLYESERKRSRFIISLANDGLHSRVKRNNFITVYGQLSGDVNNLKIKEGLTSPAPVVNAVETVTWPSAARHDAMRYQMGLRHHGFYGSFYRDMFFDSHIYHPRWYRYHHPHHFYYFP